jgi:hypothetical protein
MAISGGFEYTKYKVNSGKVLLVLGGLRRFPASKNNGNAEGSTFALQVCQQKDVKSHPVFVGF